MFLDRYRGLPTPHEGNIPTSLEYCDSTNDVGDHLYNTTNDEPIPSYVEAQCVPVPTL